MFNFLSFLKSKKDKVVFTYKRLSTLLKNLKKIKKENLVSYKIASIEYNAEKTGLICIFNTELGRRDISICLENKEIILRYFNTTGCIFKFAVNKKSYQKLFSILTLHEMDLAIYEIEEIVRKTIKIY